MLRYLTYGLRDFRDYPDHTAKRLNWEFFALHSGRLSFVQSDRRLKLSAKANFWVIPPQFSYNWKPREADAVCDRTLFSFPQVPLLLKEEVTRSGVLALKLEEKRLDRVRELAVEARPSYDSPNQLSSLAFEKILIELALIALSEVPLKSQWRLDELAGERVERIIAWYVEHMHEAPKITTICDACNISPSHMRRLFHQVMGKAPQEIFTRQRIQRACDILSTDSATLDEIASQCGFVSTSDFCRVFARVQKTSPNVWRLRVK
ncbi:helix-turn-helix transcriptional regulator [Ruficoccus amylovorans]|uniref:Helix-turn-helix transcriptional regulator n=1 Tax=Ruficoccus amylovorans TaxID=1804625 RepID=A0A842HDA3_9BACT|nr:AraC family transcriptional regulator [Ruficoccus amylovorans]MBC2594179.1 helix-turn-helix transcriptional regulator [Ruficoccus amylovorans]